MTGRFETKVSSSAVQGTANFAQQFDLPSQLDQRSSIVSYDGIRAAKTNKIPNCV